MECEAYKMMISRQADGELEESQTPDLEKHIASCPDCAAYREDLEKMRIFFEASTAPSPSAEFENRVIAAGTAEQAALQISRSRWATIRRAAAAACLMATLSLTLLVFASRDPLQAVDRNKEIHYEDLFQQALPDEDIELLKILSKTTDPRTALRIYTSGRRP